MQVGIALLALSKYCINLSLSVSMHIPVLKSQSSWDLRGKLKKEKKEVTQIALRDRLLNRMERRRDGGVTSFLLSSLTQLYCSAIGQTGRQINMHHTSA